jgi:CxxC-x17-CxxC domain-containing protein
LRRTPSGARAVAPAAGPVGRPDTTSGDIGGPRGYERGDDRISREYFAVICSNCGNQAQVPFKPRMDRPVYCSDCFRQVKPD